MSLGKRNLTTIDDLSNQEIEEIFDIADGMIDRERAATWGGTCSAKIMATLFYEPSTRTRLSFESAMQRLGGSVISSPDMRASSAAKGETLADTARVVSSYADILVVRHYWDGAVAAMAPYADVPVINAGDGTHEHPTQTLCDLYTLKKEKGELKGLTVVICGDLKHGRTIHSLVYALARFEANVVTLAAKGMQLPQYVIERLEREHHYNLVPVASDDLRVVVADTDAIYLTPNRPHQLALFTQVNTDVQDQLNQMATGLKFDAFYVTRKQKERISEGEAGNGDYPRIGVGFLKEKRFRDAVVMHPLPRVDELAHEIDKDSRGIYFKQAAYGVPVRMALLKFLFDAWGGKKAAARQKKTHLYENLETLGPLCANPNCITRKEPLSAAASFGVVFKGAGAGLLLSCSYCAERFKVQYVGHTISKRYCLYDTVLEETVRQWLQQKELVIFDSIKQAEELGYEPYKTGPQRTIMDEKEIQGALSRMAEEIVKECEEPERLLILGIRTKGAVIAKRIAEILDKKLEHRTEVGEIDIYGAGDDIRSAGPQVEPRLLEIRGRPVILVDDVIYTGRTVENALSIIFKSGRPRSVRLAVLIDRGHREVPVKPNYVGKHIPSSERERVRVKLREAEQNERDKVVIYSIISSEISHQEPAISDPIKAES
jgi:aspartate carbamoyltransferase catalytic subunit